MSVLKKSTTLLSTVTAATLGLGIALSPMAVPHYAYADAVKVTAPQAPSFADVVEAVSPAVVSVRVKASVRPASDRSGPRFGFRDLPKDHPLRPFLERSPRGGDEFGSRRGKIRPATSQGSGFFVSEDGYVVTNDHVVDNGSKFTVVLHDGTEVDATLVGKDPKTDLAVLKVEATQKFTYVAFADAKSRVGEWVVAVGNPFGLGGTVTAGIVSASGRDIGSGPYDDYVQIDAAVNKGNSGGPAFNLSGEVIGVNTAIFSPSGGNVGIAFAISAKSAKAVVDDLIKNGSVVRGWLGVQIQPVTQDIADSIGLENTAGAIISEAQEDSPAKTAGLRSGDVIVKVDDQEIADPKRLARVIAGYKPGSKINVDIIRSGDAKTIAVDLGVLPGDARKAALVQKEPTELAQLGLSIEPTGEGVVVSSVDPASGASQKGVRVGDQIVSINGQEVQQIADVGDALADAVGSGRKAVLFQLKSQRGSRFVALPIDAS